MSRTHHPRQPRDADAQRAPKAANERKRAFYSFKRINGVTSIDDDANEPAQAG